MPILIEHHEPYVNVTLLLGHIFIVVAIGLN